MVTDINLGAGASTGWAVGQHARELNPEMPIVYVTGDSAHEWPSPGVPHSVVLPKPFAPADLVVAMAGLRKIGG